MVCEDVKEKVTICFLIKRSSICCRFFPAAFRGCKPSLGGGGAEGEQQVKNTRIWHPTVKVQHILTINSYAYYVPQQTDNISTEIKNTPVSLTC